MQTKLASRKAHTLAKGWEEDWPTEEYPLDYQTYYSQVLQKELDPTLTPMGFSETVGQSLANHETHL